VASNASDVKRDLYKKLLEQKINAMKGVGSDTSPIEFDHMKEVDRAFAEGTYSREQITAANDPSVQPGTMLESGYPVPNIPPELIKNMIGKAQLETDRREKAHSSGVILDRDYPYGNFNVGFAPNPQVAIQKELSERYREQGLIGDEHRELLRVGPATKNLEWLDLEGESPRWTELNLTPEQYTGLGLPLGGDVLGTILAGKGAVKSGKGIPGMVALEAAGSAAGTFVGEVTRLVSGRVAGVHDMDSMDILAQAGELGVEAGAITMTMGTGVSVVKGISNFIKGQVYTKKAAMMHGLNSDQADEMIAELNRINKELGGKITVKTTLAKTTDDPGLLAKEEELRSTGGYGKEFIERDRADQAGITETVEGLTRQFEVAPTPKPVGDPGRTVQDAIEKQYTKGVSKGREVVAKNESELKTALDEFDTVSPQTVGEPTRVIIEKKSELAKKSADAAHDKWKKSAGYDEATDLTGIKIPLDGDALKLKKTLNRQQKDAILKLTKDKKAKIFSSVEDVAEDAQKHEDFASKFLGQKGKKIPKKDEAYDLIDYNIAISDLKSAIRNSYKTGDWATPAVRDMQRAVKALEKTRNDGLVKIGKASLIDEIEKANVKTRKMHEVYNQSILGDLTETTGTGSYRIKNEKVFRSVLNSGTQEAGKFASILKTEPEAFRAWKAAFADEYMRKVAKSGIPNKDLHKQFIDDYSSVLKHFFEPDEMAKMKKLGGLGEVVKKQQDQISNILKTVNKSGIGKLRSLDPEELIDFVAGKTGKFYKPLGKGEFKEVSAPISKVRYLKNKLKNQPEAWAQYKNAYAKRIRNSVVSNKGLTDYEAITTLLKKEGDSIKETLGQKYFDNLQTVAEVGRIAAIKGKKLSDDEAYKLVIQAIRGTKIAPPLSERGRRFTASLVYGNKKAHEIIAESLLDPKKISEVAELAKHSKFTRQTAELAASLGFIQWKTFDDANESQ